MGAPQEHPVHYPDEGEMRSVLTTYGQARDIFVPARDMVAAVGDGRVHLTMRGMRDHAAPGGDRAPVWLTYSAPWMTLFAYEMAVGRMRENQGLTRPLPQGDQPPGRSRRGYF